jgi:type II secretory pathway component PulM
VNQAGMKDALTQMKQASNESVHMEFKNVSFDQLMKLMINVLKANQVNITQFNANALATPGMVNADIIINIA